MDSLMDVVQSILGAGPSVMLPIIIFICRNYFYGVPVKKSNYFRNYSWYRNDRDQLGYHGIDHKCRPSSTSDGRAVRSELDDH